jgi:AAA15 family ATPase/GTPase
MEIFKDLEINNFRGFDHLKVENFSKVNLFLGGNNVGKTSVLEAIFLLTGMYTPAMPPIVNSVRNLKIEEPDNLKLLFHNVNLDVSPVVKATISSGESREMTLLPLYDEGHELSDLTLSSTKLSTSLVGVKSVFKVISADDTKEYSTSIRWIDNKVKQASALSYQESIRALFIKSYQKDGEAIKKLYGNLVKKKKESFVLDNLKKFDQRILSIQTLPDGIYFDMEGVDELLPLEMLGDGLKRFLLILCSIADDTSNVILIDELENGIHYSALPLLWRNVLRLAEENNTQIFISTHSYDTLKSLCEVLDTQNEYRNSAHVYSLARTLKKGYQAYEYQYESLKASLENHYELRK